MHHSEVANHYGTAKQTLPLGAMSGREFRIKKNETITLAKTKSQPPRAKYDEANDELAVPHREFFGEPVDKYLMASESKLIL